ncbi:LpqN/LpqT family lipoprotein [Rhodococcoides yunnanense]|uniref:LpqN/LpqT family lipoprotein n=1 Tax=Rhodococcoides yunnanense TaxID=278209 RepID=UPI000A06DA48|nr:LpqN/LpqT family lipoprotein [Rhodococcus yunnanensis]
MTEVPTGQREAMTVAQYLSTNGIEVAAADRDEAARLGFVAATPAGWESAPVGQFPGATEVLVEPGLVENGFAPNAVLLVGRLSAPVDPQALLECSFTDARLLPGWVESESHSADLGPWPSRFIRGSFTVENLHLEVTTRYAVVDQFLVQLTVTVLVDQVDRLAFDVSAINDGLLAGHA